MGNPEGTAGFCEPNQGEVSPGTTPPSSFTSRPRERDGHGLLQSVRSEAAKRRPIGVIPEH